LLRNGQSYTPFQVASASPAEGSFLFSLRHMDLGVYDVEVELASGDQFSFPDGFRIVSDSSKFQFKTSIGGANTVRSNRWSHYTLTVHNNKSRIANGVMAFIAVPEGVDTDLDEVLYKRTGSLTIGASDYNNRLTINRDSFVQTYFEGDFNPSQHSYTVNYDSIYQDMKE